MRIILQCHPRTHTSNELPSTDEKCEIVCAQVHLEQAKYMYMGAYYRQPNADTESHCSLYKGSELTVELAWCTFRDGLLDIQEKEVPFKKATRLVNIPWFNNKLKRQVQKKHPLYSMGKCNPEKMCTFKHHKAKVQKAIRSAHWDYVNQVLEE